ncbi:MAG: T9SS type A sorting domain-containing protein, partial [Bacteroidota bacterium]|nr:T9SS type A sorting domain-containing protein [Bacteroidota bacterium]
SEIPNMSNTIFDSNVAWFTNWPGGGIYKSVNSGENWSLNHTNLFSGWGMDICDEDPDFIMTGSWSGNNTSFTTNGGESWTTTPGLIGAGGVMILVDRGYIIGQAGNSVYKLNILYSVNTSVTENIISNIPKIFDLSQNFPNPFNPTTKIRYDLPISGDVVLKVYNELGKEMTTLVNAHKSAGTHEITFDAAEYASGIYFYKLESEGLISTKKMLLVK